jgi:hypothetical protein
VKKYSKNEIDFFGIYDAANQQGYFIPIEEVTGISRGIFSKRCVSRGFPASGSSGFARFSVRGHKRVAKPPARMKACIGIFIERTTAILFEVA